VKFELVKFVAVAVLLFAPCGITQTPPAALTNDAGSAAPKEVVDWFRNAAIPLKTTNPYADLEDMSPLLSVVSNARIVAMGEGTHGSREFFQMKHRMLEFLVEKMGFTIFGIEANWPESLAVNDYVLNGKGDPAVVLAGLYFWTWNTEEVLNMIRWMRRYNEDPSHAKKVQFLGFDMQIARVAVSSVEDYLQRVDRRQYHTASEILAPLADEASEREYAHRTKELRQQTSQGIKSLLAVFDQRKRDYVAASSEREWLLTRHNLEIVMQAEALCSSKNPTVRDRYMAENVKWILDQEPPGTKIMLWAHNEHVWTSDTLRGEPMGKVLRQMYGKEMVVCGFAFDQGSFRAVPQPRNNVPGRSKFLVGPAAPDTWERASRRLGFRSSQSILEVPQPELLKNGCKDPI
jgi:erythromycin esterase